MEKQKNKKYFVSSVHLAAGAKAAEKEMYGHLRLWRNHVIDGDNLNQIIPSMQRFLDNYLKQHRTAKVPELSDFRVDGGIWYHCGNDLSMYLVAIPGEITFLNGQPHVGSSTEQTDK